MNMRGFIDLHTHGIGSFDTRTSCPEDILKMAELHCKAGTGAFLPTIYSSTLDAMRTNMEAVRRAMEIQRSLPATSQSSMILGLYPEGPFLNPLRCGALDRKSFLKPAISSLKKLVEGYEEIVKIVTIAPELPGALRVIEKCSEMGIRVHMGHSDGTYTQAGEGKKAGAVGVTHIFNAMKPFHHREPGLVGFGLLDEDLTVEVIADGVHISPEALKLIFSIKKPEKIILVSDSVRGAGKRGRPARNAQGILEGGGATISGCLGVLRKIGIPEEEIYEVGFANPLRHLQLDPDVLTSLCPSASLGSGSVRNSPLFGKEGRGEIF